jgi:hypothetical protein
MASTRPSETLEPLLQQALPNVKSDETIGQHSCPVATPMPDQQKRNPQSRKGNGY